MGARALSPLRLTELRLEGVTLVLDAEGEEDEAACPSCSDGCRRVHDRYRCSPLDLPWRGFAVRLAVPMRRFCWTTPFVLARRSPRISGHRYVIGVGSRPTCSDICATSGKRWERARAPGWPRHGSAPCPRHG